jgi:small GTP-binding protein
MKRLNDIENSINNKIKNSTDSLNLLKNENENSIKNEQDKIQELKTEPLKLINNIIMNKDDIDMPKEIKTAKGEIDFDDFEIMKKKSKEEEKKENIDKNKIDENKEKNVININNKDNINEIKFNDKNKNDKISLKKSLRVDKKPSFKEDLNIIKLFDPDDDKTQLFFFVILIGESNVGKTWIFNNFFTLPYTQSLSIGLESEEIFFKIEEETLISLNILVCPGKFNQLNLISSKDLIIFVYSIDKRNSFENLKAKIKEIKTKSKKEAHYILVGNKIDLEEQRVVKKEEGEKLAKDENFDLFLEVSAKDGKNIDKIFFDACKILYKSRVINE